MKNFLCVKDKIKLLSSVTGLPICYAGDLDIHLDNLKNYDGANLVAIDPLHALKKIACGIKRIEDTILHLNVVHSFTASVKDLSIQ